MIPGVVHFIGVFILSSLEVGCVLKTSSVH